MCNLIRNCADRFQSDLAEVAAVSVRQFCYKMLAHQRSAGSIGNKGRAKRKRIFKNLSESQSSPLLQISKSKTDLTTLSDENAAVEDCSYQEVLEVNFFFFAFLQLLAPRARTSHKQPTNKPQVSITKKQ